MSLQVRTKFYAWFLLSVFVPMLWVMSLHHHEDCCAHEVTCVDCLHHVPHAGHLTHAQAALHDCVLCQWYAQPYLYSTCRLASAVDRVEAWLFVAPCRELFSGKGYSIPQRGPPALVFGR